MGPSHGFCLKYQRPIPGKSTAATSSEAVQEASATSGTCGMLRSHGWMMRCDNELARNEGKMKIQIMMMKIMMMMMMMMMVVDDDG